MILTDDILLEIFVFYRHTYDDALWEWHVLVHVCRRWRQIVFESPRLLDLKIRCTTKTPAKENLSIWPAFPIAIDFRPTLFDSIPSNAVAAFEDTGRISYLKLDLTELRSRTSSWSKTFTTLTSKPFPVLTHLIIHIPVEDGLAPPLPDDFLGGYAPRLQIIHLHNIAFPALQTFLLSARHLVELRLHRIPRVDIISPVTMAMCLAELPRLKTLVLQFQSRYPPHNTPVHSPPVTRPVHPALTSIEFTGPSYYLEGIVPHIDCPRLNQITISYMSWLRNFQFEQLFGFFNRTISPFGHVKVYFHDHGVTFNLYHPTNRTDWHSHPATTVISCQSINWRLFDLLNDFSVILSTVVDLKFVGKLWSTNSLNNGCILEWLPFLHQLPALQTLYVSLPLAEGFAHALKSVKGEEVAKALPSLELFGLEGQTSSIEEFAGVRQLSDCPLTVVGTEAEFDQRLSARNC